MTAVNKINSNSTGLSYAWEDSIKTLPGTPVWIPLEPNSYNDFGGNLTTVARNPINSSRQRKKGVVTDLEASGGFQTDITQTNMQDLLQGFFCANLRKKGECKNAIGTTTITVSVTASSSTLTRVGGTLDLTTQFAADDLVYVSGFSQSANNGLFKVSSLTSTTLVLVAADGAETAVTLVDEAATANASIVKVGVESAAGDVDVDMTGSLPALTSTTLDFTDLGVVPGEFIYIGGDETAVRFATAANNGFARVRSVAAGRLELDKTQSTWVTEANTTKLVQIFLGRVLKNETGSGIVFKSCQLERTLGYSDSTHTLAQAEYLEGAYPNEFTLNVSSASKLTADLSFVAVDHATRASGTVASDTVGPKTGTRVALVEADAFNTSSDVSRIKLASVSASDANPTPLFAFATEVSIAINNNNSLNKAIGVLGGFDVSAGTFQVSGNITAYLADIAAVQAVRANGDITMDMHFVKANAGISVDLPLLTLGDGRSTVEQDAPIMLPLTNEAATGAKISSSLDHTLLMVFFDYLPSLADA